MPLSPENANVLVLQELTQMTERKHALHLNSASLLNGINHFSWPKEKQSHLSFMDPDPSRVALAEAAACSPCSSDKLVLGEIVLDYSQVMSPFAAYETCSRAFCRHRARALYRLLRF
jgi:hypothetical protein